VTKLTADRKPDDTVIMLPVVLLVIGGVVVTLLSSTSSADDDTASTAAGDNNDNDTNDDFVGPSTTFVVNGLSEVLLLVVLARVSRWCVAIILFHHTNSFSNDRWPILGAGRLLN
jgi:hypothetical protein